MMEQQVCLRPKVLHTYQKLVGFLLQKCREMMQMNADQVYGSNGSWLLICHPLSDMIKERRMVAKIGAHHGAWGSKQGKTRLQFVHLRRKTQSTLN